MSNKNLTVSYLTLHFSKYWWYDQSQGKYPYWHPANYSPGCVDVDTALGYILTHSRCFAICHSCRENNSLKLFKRPHSSIRQRRLERVRYLFSSNIFFAPPCLKLVRKHYNPLYFYLLFIEDSFRQAKRGWILHKREVLLSKSAG